MSAAPPAQRPASVGGRTGWSVALTVVSISVGSAFCCGGCGYVMANLFHSGEEFSPQTWERRTYAYEQLSPFGWQIRPLRRLPAMRSSLESYLVGQKLVPIRAQADRWDVVQSVEPMPASYHDAAILIQAIDELDDSGFVWRTWSKDHPELARVLWPCVATLAEDYLYVYVPEALDLAREAKDPAAFEKTLTERMQAIYSELAGEERAAGRTPVADRLAARADLFGKPDWREILFKDSVEPTPAVVKESEKEPEPADVDGMGPAKSEEKEKEQDETEKKATDSDEAKDETSESSPE